MKGLIWLIGLMAVGSGVMAMGIMFSPVERFQPLALALCPVALICGLLFLILAARQSRLESQ